MFEKEISLFFTKIPFLIVYSFYPVKLFFIEYVCLYNLENFYKLYKK